MKNLILIFLLFLGAVQLNAKDVYLIIGQSNTAGRAPIKAKDQAVLVGVELFDGTNWVEAVNPMNQYSNIRKDINLQRLGYSYTFGRTLHAVTGIDIGLVVNARGGTDIESWQKGAAEGYYDSSLSILNDALATSGTDLKAIIWHQGEADRNNPNYLMDLETMLNDFRIDLGMPNLPFIAGQLSQEREDNYNFNANLTTLPDIINNTDYVLTNDLGTTDSIHFNSNAQRIIGGRYAAKVLEMIYGYEYKTTKVWVREDAYIRGGDYADKNYGDEIDVLVKEQGAGNENTKRGFLKFDLSSVNGYIIDAYLHTTTRVESGCETINVGFYETSSLWSESSITFNNAPSLIDEILVQVVRGYNYDNEQFFVSEYIQEEFGTSTDISIGLKGDNIASEQLKFIAKEESIGLTGQAYLSVNYIIAGSGTGSAGNTIGLSKPDILVFPNPASGQLTIYFEAGFVKVRVLSLLGRELINQNTQISSTMTIGIEKLPPSTYLLIIDTPEGEQIQQLFVKQ